MQIYDLSVVVVNYNSGEYLYKLIQSIVQNTQQITYEIIVVDNSSTDESLSKITSFPSIKIIKNAENVGFAKANNMGIRLSNGKAILLINPDVWIEKDIFYKMFKYLRDYPSVGIVGCRITFPDGTVQTSAYSYTTLGKRLLQLIVSPFQGLLENLKKFILKTRLSFFNKVIRNHIVNYLNDDSINKVDYVSGACMMFRSEIVQEVGYLDEKFFMYYEDEDFCRRVNNKGFTIIYMPGIAVIHKFGWAKNRRNLDLYNIRRESLFYYCRKYYITRPFYYSLFRLVIFLQFRLKAGF